MVLRIAFARWRRRIRCPSKRRLRRTPARSKMRKLRRVNGSQRQRTARATPSLSSTRARPQRRKFWRNLTRSAPISPINSKASSSRVRKISNPCELNMKKCSCAPSRKFKGLRTMRRKSSRHRSVNCRNASPQTRLNLTASKSKSRVRVPTCPQRSVNCKSN